MGSVTQILEDLSLGGPTANRFDNPLVTYNRQIGNLLTQFNMHQIAFFGQDSWRVTRKLSIDLGLRWEGQKNPQPDANNTAVISTIKGLRFPNGDTFDPATTPRGTGLQGISDRLGALGGTADVTAAPGRGTRVTGRVPGTELA